MFCSATPPETEYDMEGTLLGYEYLRAYAELWPRYQLYSDNDLLALSEYDKDVKAFATRLTSDNREVVKTILHDPAEIQLPIGLAYLRGYLPEDATWSDGDVCVLHVDKA
eukprot:7711349-Pyramimonas_sp.AAC.1